MKTNPYESPTAPFVETQGTARDRSGDSTPRLYRWQTIPTALSWFATSLLLICAIVWLCQIGGVLLYGGEFVGFWMVAPCMTFVLFASSALNLMAGRGWMSHRYASALTFNAGSGLLIWITGTLLELYIKSS